MNSTITEIITKQHISEIQTRKKTAQEFIYDKYPETRSALESMKFDLGPMWERPINLDNTSWTTTNSRFALILNKKLLNSFFSQNLAFARNIKSYAFYRAHGCVYVSITGTIVHQGMLLAAVVPHNVAESMSGTGFPINTLLSCPHAFLGANEATSACIELPFYVPTDYLSINVQPPSEVANFVTPDLSYGGNDILNNYANLVIMVVNPLSTGAGSSTSLNVVSQLEIKKFEVYGLHPSLPSFTTPPALESIPESIEETQFQAQSFLAPLVSTAFDKTASAAKSVTGDFIDGVRQAIRGYTGLHNPNNTQISTRMIPTTRNFSNQVDTETFYEKLDPNSTFSRLTRDAIFHTHVDEMQLSHILSKPQYIGTCQISATTPDYAVLFAGPISPYQGGCSGSKSICNNIELLSIMSRAWRGDLELIIQSSMTNKQNVKVSIAKYYAPPYAVYTQRPDVDTLRMLPNSLLEFSGGNQTLTVDLEYLARNELTYINLDKRANTSVGVYYVYLNQPLVYSADVPISMELNFYIRCKPNFRLYGYSLYPATRSRTSALALADDPTNFIAESTASVMNEPSINNVLNDNTVNTENNVYEFERLMPNLDMRPYLRRMQFTNKTSTTGTGTSYVMSFNVANLVYQYAQSDRKQPANTLLASMFLGINGGVKLKLLTTNSNAMITYLPPTLIAGPSVLGSTHPLYTQQLYDENTPEVTISSGSLHNGPFIEFPQSTALNANPTQTYAIYEMHVPHNTIYNYWGNGAWTKGSPVQEMNATLGTIFVSGNKQTDTQDDFYWFVGWDDETRMGFHTIAPFITFSTSGTGATEVYEIPLTGPLATGSSSNKIKVAPPVCYYSNLVTPFT